MANVFAVKQIQLWKGPYLSVVDEERGGPEETWFKETAAQTYGVNDLVYLDSNGTVAICTETSHKQNSAILGLANTAATGVTGTTAKARVITPNDRFVMSLFHTTAASAVSAQTQLGAIFGIYHDTAAVVYAGGGGTGGAWTVDLINTSPETGGALARVRVVGFLLGPDLWPTSTGSYVAPAIGDQYAPVIVKFLSLSVQSDGSSHTNILQG